MKIGILTYFWDENPGTLLQAYSLVSVISKKLPRARVELINYQHLVSRYKIIRNYLKFDYALNDYIRLRRYRKFKKEHLKIGTPALVSQNMEEIENYLNRCSYDLIIVGSDTVWQISEKKERPSFPNIYWTPESVKSKKVAYAVSANKTNIDDIGSDKVREAMEKILSGFELIGVRDTMTKKLADHLTRRSGKEVSLVPDPTFLLEQPHIDAEKIIEKAGFKIQGGPILGINYPNGAFCKEIIMSFRKKGYRIISLAQNSHADLCLPSLDPFTWANMYRLFNLVITDRFHGTIFALKHLKPVFSIDWSLHRFDTQGNSKLRSLLTEFGMEKTNHFNINEMNKDADRFCKAVECAYEAFDKTKVSKVLKEKKRKGMNFLKDVFKTIGCHDKAYITHP